jgi:hypothetical protein
MVFNMFIWPKLVRRGCFGGGEEGEFAAPLCTIAPEHEAMN